MKIRSNRELVYRTRENRRGIIELVINKYEFLASTKEFIIHISDYYLSEYGAPVFIEENKRVKSSQEVLQLAEALQQSFTPGDDLTLFLQRILEYALLYITVNDAEPVYGSTPSDWYIVEETENTEETLIE